MLTFSPLTLLPLSYPPKRGRLKTIPFNFFSHIPKKTSTSHAKGQFSPFLNLLKLLEHPLKLRYTLKKKIIMEHFSDGVLSGYLKRGSVSSWIPCLVMQPSSTTASQNREDFRHWQPMHEGKKTYTKERKQSNLSSFYNGLVNYYSLLTLSIVRIEVKLNPMW